MIGMVPVSLALSGNGDRQVVEGRIVGFSNRLNTIIVPESFMQWSNEKFGDGSAKQPSRLIVEVSKPGDVAIGEYMDAHGYEIGGDKADSGKASYFLNVTIGIVVAVGALISLLSFFRADVEHIPVVAEEYSQVARLVDAGVYSATGVIALCQAGGGRQLHRAGGGMHRGGSVQGMLFTDT